MLKTTEKDIPTLLNRIRKTLHDRASDIDFIKLEPFRLVRLGPSTPDNESIMFVKEILGAGDTNSGRGGTAIESSRLPLPRGVVGVQFKCVIMRKFPQAFKHYLNMEINEMDRTYVDQEGRIHIMPPGEVWRPNDSPLQSTPGDSVAQIKHH